MSNKDLGTLGKFLIEIGRQVKIVIYCLVSAQWSEPPSKIKPFFRSYCLRWKVLGVFRYKQAFKINFKIFMCLK